MKFRTTEIFVLALIGGVLCYYAGGCQSEITAFDFKWITLNGSFELRVNCCATLLSSLQFLVSNVILPNEKALKEHGITPVSTSGGCVNYTIDYLPENFHGSLTTKCNAEQGGFENVCQSKLHTIELPPSSTTKTLTMNEDSTNPITSGNPGENNEATSRETITSGNPGENNETTRRETSVIMNSTMNVTVTGNSTAIPVSVGVLSAAAVAAVFFLVIGIVLHRKVKNRQNTPQNNHDHGTYCPTSKNATDPSSIISLEQMEGHAEETKLDEMPSDEISPLQQESNNCPSLGSRKNNSLPATMCSRSDDVPTDKTQVLAKNPTPFHIDPEEGTVHTPSHTYSTQCTDHKEPAHGSKMFVGLRGTIV